MTCAKTNGIVAKPAGAGGSTGPPVAQGGNSKRLNQVADNDMFSKIAAMLGRAEQQISELTLLVLDEGQPRSERAAIKNHYPTQFDLFTAEELAKTIAQFQGILAAAGNAPSARNPIPASWPSLPTKPRPHWSNRSRPSRPTKSLERRSRSG